MKQAHGLTCLAVDSTAGQRGRGIGVAEYIFPDDSITDSPNIETDL